MRSFKQSVGGTKHEDNEDNCDFRWVNSNGKKYLVNCMADGCSGYNGSVASSLAVSHSFNYLKRSMEGKRVSELGAGIKEALIDVNQKLHKIPVSRTTFDIMVIPNNHKKMRLAHLGDSRVYFIYKDGFYQITEDESFQVRSQGPSNYTGQVYDNADRHIRDRIIFPDPFKYSQEVPLEVLMCTDGLTDVISNDELQEYFFTGNREQNPNDFISFLIEEAIKRGTTDDTSLLLWQKEDSVKKIYVDFGGLNEEAARLRASNVLLLSNIEKEKAETARVQGLYDDKNKAYTELEGEKKEVDAELVTKKASYNLLETECKSYKTELLGEPAKGDKPAVLGLWDILSSTKNDLTTKTADYDSIKEKCDGYELELVGKPAEGDKPAEQGLREKYSKLEKELAGEKKEHNDVKASVSRLEAKVKQYEILSDRINQKKSSFDASIEFIIDSLIISFNNLYSGGRKILGLDKPKDRDNEQKKE